MSSAVAPSELLYFSERGSGPPLLLVHGLMVTGEMFAPVVELFAARHRVIVPDLRGHGRQPGAPAAVHCRATGRRPVAPVGPLGGGHLGLFAGDIDPAAASDVAATLRIEAVPVQDALMQADRAGRRSWRTRPRHCVMA